MILKGNNVLIDDVIEEKLIYWALVDFRMNGFNHEAYYKTLDQLIYDFKKHLYLVSSTRFLF